MQVNDSEIVVAAQRREETANSVGMGIQAFTGEQLVVWATADPNFAVEPVFEANAPSLHALALHFVAADHDHRARQSASAPVQLTRREIQCLKWGAAGKTDGEISVIMSISVPTVRFHMTNATRKLNVTGRSQAIYRAATLGYVGGSGRIRRVFVAGRAHLLFECRRRGRQPMRTGMMRALVGAAVAAALLGASASAQNAPARDPSFGRGERVSGLTWGTRSPVVAPHGAAATAHPLATQTALDVMRAGGTAVDAAIAANAMLGLVEPTANGIGGDIFVIVWDPRTQRLYGYNGSGRSPRGLSLAQLRRVARQQGHANQVPSFGAASNSVPGTVDGWFALHERFGRKPMAELLAPAIHYAREGAPIPQTIAMYWAGAQRRFETEYAAGRLEEINNARSTYFCDLQEITVQIVDPHGRDLGPTYQCGDSKMPNGHGLFRNPDLANTLELIAQGGRDAYYRGPIARTIDSYMRRIGGYLRYDDFARHQGEWVDPVCAPYRGVQVCELPPNSQGVVALQTLRILEGFDLRGMGFMSADSLHTQIEATRLAFADRAQFYGDPAFTHFDVRRLLTDDYTAQRRALIHNDHAMPPPPHAEMRIDGDTTYFAVADSDGMMVSIIQSNYRGMGSGLVPDRLGFMLQDRGELFSLSPGPNQYRPGRRPFQTIIPAFALRDGQPWLAFGLMGGDMQPQGHVQIIVNLVDYDMDLQAAGDAARYRFYGGVEPTGEEPDGVGFVAVENGVPPEVRAELERRGHRIRPADGSFGGYQAIMRNANGVYEAATEMRKDGSAGGY